ncbi:MAG: prephenate dehydratase [Thermoleophilia bacterium]|nr:prephenate dehydratase [Thermoleophilia bacterium]
MPIAFQGIAGAFGEEALVQRFGEAAERVGLTSFADVFRAVADGTADAGLVPIENSLAGSILENYDLLLEHGRDVQVVGEVVLPVRHCLLAPPGTRLPDITRCHSHPQALAQCAAFLREHGIEPVAAANTAVAARDVAALAEPGVAAIASARAGRIHGIEVVAADVQTRSDNTTRFFVLARERDASAAADKASLAFTTRNRPGALLASLEGFRDAGLNLTRIESRPTGAALWEYTFHVDVEAAEGDALEEAVLADVLAVLEQRGAHARVLGRYARG